MKKVTILFFLFFLATFSVGQTAYLLVGPTRDAGNVGRSDSVTKRMAGIRGSLEIGYNLSPKEYLVGNLSFIGYTNYDGTYTQTVAVEYNRLITLPGDNLSIVFGGGVGYSRRYPVGGTIPFRLGMYYDIVVGDYVSIRLGLVDRPQFFVESSEFNHGISFMAGFKF